MPQLDLNTKIEFVKGVGPQKAEVFQKELKVFTVSDLLDQYPFRYVDKTEITLVKDIKSNGQMVQCVLEIISYKLVKGKFKSRLVASCKDASGFMELIWFQGASWMDRYLHEGKKYLVYGKINLFGGKRSIVHPELELIEHPNQIKTQSALDPVYPSTDKLNNKGMDAKFRKACIKHILDRLDPKEIREVLPEYLKSKLRLIGKYEAICKMHLPKEASDLQVARDRLKFDEIFFLQLRMLASKQDRLSKFKSFNFSKVGSRLNDFYTKYLSFDLTGAQKRVIKEIRADLGTGFQMNRLLQGDVGSGKTIVAVMSMLIALDNNLQACLMAPTEILAQQHFKGISEYLEQMDIRVELLTGTVKGKKRTKILEDLKEGEIDILIGTHALIEPTVVFKKLGLAVIDEQHRFGVIQRSKLWNKNPDFPPHILVMTATPIPRTLALTVYGDLDVSIIDEMPPGRKSIKTVHRREKHRPQVIAFMHDEIKKGRQIYVVYPLIDESAKLDLQNLNSGYEFLLQYFPMPQYQISVVHGRMKAKDKEMEMERFVKGQTQIMVATTVIEVGVNVPNASVMIIENTERFGLSQLHQLRGRVGRGGEQSFCVLMTGDKLSNEARKRIKTMVETNDGFKIAEADLEIRGPGNIEGTQQSGVLDFKVFNLIADNHMIEKTRTLATQILEADPGLTTPANKPLSDELLRMERMQKNLRRIS